MKVRVRSKPTIEIGKVYGKLTALKELAQRDAQGSVTYEFICECGKSYVRAGTPVKKGLSKDCGCGKLRYDEPWKFSAVRIYDQNYSDGDLSFVEFLRLSQENCHYCNSPPSNCVKASKSVTENRKHLYEWVYQGLDRVDNTKPHNLDNLVPCCKVCNKAKLKQPYDVFLKHIIKIYNHRVLNSSVETWHVDTADRTGSAE